MLVSTVVIADTIDRFDSESVYDERVTEEIYEDAIDWRIPPATAEDEWRAAQQEAEQQQSQFRFGFDSAYEQTRSQQSDFFRSQQDEIGGSKPTSQFRFSW